MSINAAVLKVVNAVVGKQSAFRKRKPTPNSARNIRPGPSGQKSVRLSTPRPLARELSAAMQYPAHVLGKILTPATVAIHDIVQAPMAFGAASILCVACLAVQGHANVLLPHGSAVPLSCAFCTIGESGSRKTAADNLAMQALRQFLDAARIVYRAALRSYKRAHALWTKQEGTNDDEPQKPLNPQMIIREPTYEGMIKSFSMGFPSQGLFSSEGGGFLGGAGMSDDRRLRMATGLSELWDGAPLERVRAGEEVSELVGRRLAINLFMQPDVSTRLLGDPAMKDQGLLSRMLVAYPESNIGNRPYKQPLPESYAAMTAYSDHIRWLLQVPLPVKPGSDGELAPRLLPISSSALPLWIAFYDEIERGMKSGGPLESVRGFGSKAAEHAARIAGVLTLFDDIYAPEIPASAMAAGIELTRFYLSEALRLFGMPPVPKDLQDAQALLDWLRKRESNKVALVEMYQKGPTSLRNKKSATHCADILIDHGWLVRLPGRHKIDGKFREEVFELQTS